MPDADRPQELPARLLTDPQMIDACRVRDFARVFRLVKTRAGIYPSMIARRCDLTPSRVGEVIAGRRQLQHMDVIERISDGLRIPGHMLGLARRPWETPQVLVVTEREAPQEPELEKQTPASLPGPDVDNILALATRTTLSAATLEAFRSSIEDYWRRDDQHGGEALRPAIVGQLRYVVGSCRRADHRLSRMACTESPPSWHAGRGTQVRPFSRQLDEMPRGRSVSRQSSQLGKLRLLELVPSLAGRMAEMGPHRARLLSP